MAVPKKKVSFRRRALKRKVKPFVLGSIDLQNWYLAPHGNQGQSKLTIKRHHSYLKDLSSK